MCENREDSYTFTCPECGEEMEVNDGMREALLEHGCVICGAGLSPEAFSLVSSAT